jgi:hypothetical protein
VGSSAMHEVCAHGACDGERAVDGFLIGLGHAQEQECDEGDGDLDAHGVLGGGSRFDRHGLNTALDRFALASASVERDAGFAPT